MLLTDGGTCLKILHWETNGFDERFSPLTTVKCRCEEKVEQDGLNWK